MMHPLIPICDVVMFGALQPDGETLTKCRITMVGKPTNAVLYARDVDGMRWRRVDRLTQANVAEHDDGTVTIEGVSDELIDIVGMKPSDAGVRWEVDPKGCVGCR